MLDAAQIVNYGLDRVRFLAPLRVDSPVRMAAEVLAVDGVHGGYQVTYRSILSVPGQERPVCVAIGILRYYRRGINR